MLIYTLDRDDFFNTADPDGTLTLAETKDAVCAMIDQAAADIRLKWNRLSSPYEAAFWVLKSMEATKFLATGLDQDAPNVALEAVTRGVTTLALATQIDQNAAKFKTREAKIAGIAGLHKDAVRAQPSKKKVLDYDWRTGWPGS